MPQKIDEDFATGVLANLVYLRIKDQGVLPVKEDERKSSVRKQLRDVKDLFPSLGVEIDDAAIIDSVSSALIPKP